MCADTLGTAAYWDAVSATYQATTRISTRDFHYGPLLPGDRELGLLPDDLAGLRCLEVGCGAGQNSMVLARRGADCTAIDISAKQLDAGRALATAEGLDIDFRLADMDELAGRISGVFDLVHSTYALPFARNQEALIRTCRDLLVPGGQFLLTTAHPLYSGEWVDIDDDEEGEGLLLSDYFHPPDDVRIDVDDLSEIRMRSVPISTLTEWLRTAGFRLDRLQEPEPVTLPLLTEDEIRDRVPYESDAWRELYPVLQRIPVVVILSATRVA